MFYHWIGWIVDTYPKGRVRVNDNTFGIVFRAAILTDNLTTQE